MMARSVADHYRAHREAFVLAQQLGCTPKEAAEQLRIRAARDREDSSRRRLEARMSDQRLRAFDDGAERRDEPWMMRD